MEMTAQEVVNRVRTYLMNLHQHVLTTNDKEINPLRYLENKAILEVADSLDRMLLQIINEINMSNDSKNN